MARCYVTWQLRKCDLVVEVRDARIPFTSSNPLLDEVGGVRRANHIERANPIAIPILLILIRGCVC
jgi:hypothetical protein